MLWALLALLGVPIWLVVGALVAAGLSRHRFRAQPDVVPMMLRSVTDDKWSRRPAHGRLRRPQSPNGVSRQATEQPLVTS